MCNCVRLTFDSRYAAKIESFCDKRTVPLLLWILGTTITFYSLSLHEWDDNGLSYNQKKDDNISRACGLKLWKIVCIFSLNSLSFGECSWSRLHSISALEHKINNFFFIKKWKRLKSGNMSFREIVNYDKCLLQLLKAVDGFSKNDLCVISTSDIETIW